MNQSSHSTVWWWIAGVIVVVLSGTAAYFYASNSAPIPTPVVTFNTPKSLDGNEGNQKSISINTVFTVSELDSVAKGIGSNLTSLDSYLSDLDSVDTIEEPLSL